MKSQKISISSPKLASPIKLGLALSDANPNKAVPPHSSILELAGPARPTRTSEQDAPMKPARNSCIAEKWRERTKPAARVIVKGMSAADPPASPSAHRSAAHKRLTRLAVQGQGRAWVGGGDTIAGNKVTRLAVQGWGGVGGTIAGGQQRGLGLGGEAQQAGVR
jgi:hypothetical protein